MKWSCISVTCLTKCDSLKWLKLKEGKKIERGKKSEIMKSKQDNDYLDFHSGIPFIARYPRRIQTEQQKQIFYLENLFLTVFSVQRMRSKLLSISILMAFNFHWKVQRNQITIDDGTPANCKQMKINDNHFIWIFVNRLRNGIFKFISLSIFVCLFAQDNINFHWIFH